MTKTQRRALKKLEDRPGTPETCGVPYTTFMALERRKLISVETSFNSIAFPRKAMAWITGAGRAALLAKIGEGP